MAFVLLPIACYILKSLSLYTISQRRGIHNSWISWVPVFNGWMLGCISDQYRYVTRGETKRRRTALLVFPVVEVVLAIMLLVVTLIAMMLEVSSEDPLNVAKLLLAAVLLLVRVAHFVVEQLATLDYHRSCDPENAMLFFVVGVVVSPLCPLFLFLNRNKELGMPPRISEPV